MDERLVSSLLAKVLLPLPVLPPVFLEAGEGWVEGGEELKSQEFMGGGWAGAQAESLWQVMGLPGTDTFLPRTPVSLAGFGC